MEISLNGIKIDWVKFIPKNFSAETTEHTIMRGTTRDITSHIHVNNRVIPLQCMIKDSFFTADKEIRFENLHEMALNKQIIELSSTSFSLFKLSNTKYDEDYAIVDIEETGRGEGFIEFSLNLKAINFTTLKKVKTSIQPDKSLKTSATKGSKKQIGEKQNIPAGDYGVGEGWGI